MLGKSHRYISWIAEFFKGHLGWSNCWVLTPVGAKFGKYGAGVGENSSLAEWFCFKNDLFFLQRHTRFMCWCSATPLRDKTRLCGVCSGKTGAGFQFDNSNKVISYSSSVSLSFSALCCGVQARRLITLCSCNSLRQSRVHPGGLRQPRCFSADWRGSLMQVFQWNLHNPDANTVASPSGLDMSGNEHYWADKISEHFFHRKLSDFHLRVWHASSLRLLEKHTLDCLWQDMNRRAQADMKSQAGMAVRKEKTLYYLLSTLKMCSGKDYNVKIVILVA